MPPGIGGRDVPLGFGAPRVDERVLHRDGVGARRALGRLARRAWAGQLGRWVQMPRDLVAASPVALTWVHADNRSSNAYLFNLSARRAALRRRIHRTAMDPEDSALATRGRWVPVWALPPRSPPRSNARGVRHGAVLFLTAWRRAPRREWSPSRCLPSRQVCLLAAYPPLRANVPQGMWMSTAPDMRVVARLANVRHILLSSSERLVPAGTLPK